MAELVIDLFEVIQIEKHNCGIFLVALTAVHGGLKKLMKQCAIGQSGQAVVLSHFQQLVFKLFALGDVLEDKYGTLNCVAGI